MATKLIKALMATTLVVTGLAFASIASAQTPAPGVTFTEQKYTFSSTSVSLVEKGSAQLGLQLRENGRLVLHWERPGWKPKTQKRCRWVTGGTNSYLDRAGKRHWIDWTGKRAYICPDRTSSTGWRKAGGPPTWENCGNEFIPVFKRIKVKLFQGAYIVERFASYAFRLVGVASLMGSVTATANCVTSDGRTGSSSSASASGVGRLSLMATGRGKSRSQARASARGKVLQMLSTQQSKVQLEGNARFQINLNLTAVAGAVCQQAPVVPPPVTPPPVTPTGQSCSVSSVLQKDGRTVTATLSYTGSPSSSTISWGDGTSTGGTSASHTYGSNGTWGITASLKYADGTSASCSAQVTTNAQAAQPPPTSSSPGTPGPNPSNTPSSPSGPDNQPQLTPCPPGWTGAYPNCTPNP